MRARRFAVSVAAAQGFVGKYVVLQRYRAGKRMWKTVKRVRLSKAKPGVAPTVVTSASFGASVPRRTRLRLLFTQDQVGACYAATRSAVVRPDPALTAASRPRRGVFSKILTRGTQLLNV